MDHIKEKALLLAQTHHSTGIRKYSKLPYIVHPIQVGTYLDVLAGAGDVAVAVGYLHDVLEDTKCSWIDFKRNNLDLVYSYVTEVTNKYTHESFPDLIRSKRKIREAHRIVSGSKIAVLVKCADMLSNLDYFPDILIQDSIFSKVYLNECTELFDLVVTQRKDINEPLLEMLDRRISICNKLLNGFYTNKWMEKP